MKIPALVPIVEGHSEAHGAIRNLLERVIYDFRKATGIRIATPYRVKRDKVVNRPGKLAAAIINAARDREERGFHVASLLVVLDAEDDCPVEIAAKLKEEASRATRFPVAVVLANKMIENWVVGSKESLTGICGIRKGATAPADPEGVRPLERLCNNMVGSRRYQKTADLSALLAKLDIGLCAERCRSFRKFVKEVEYLIERMAQA